MNNNGRFMRLGIRLILGLGLLTAVSLFGQVTANHCRQQNEYNPRVPGFVNVIDQNRTILEVYNSKGVLLQQWIFTKVPGQLGSVSPKFTIEERNAFLPGALDPGVPYNPSNTPGGAYPSTSVDALIASLCPGGVFAAYLRGALGAKDSAAPAGSSSPSGQAAQYVALGDFNGDGILDTATETSTGISVNLYQANGTFATTVYPISGLQTSSIVAVDFNGDGNLDLAVPLMPDASGQGHIAVLLGRGDGTFGAPSNVAAGGPYPFYLATGDFNADGKTDLAITNQPADIGTAGTVSVLLGEGNGSFASPVSYNVGDFPGTIVAADFNGDGKADLAALDNATGVAYVNKLWVLLGNGDGTFKTAVSTATATSAGYLSYADLNHDGKLDALIADQNASDMAVLMGNGDGTFQPPTLYLAAAQPVSVGVVPLGDGNTAIFLGDAISGNIALGFAASDGTMGIPPLQSIGQSTAAIVTGNLNGDSQPDLVISDPVAGNLDVLLATGKGTFGSPATYSAGSTPGALALADLRGDGKLDAIVGTASGLGVLLGTGSGAFGTAQFYTAGDTFGSVAIADFNGDGKPDVAAVDATAGVVSVFLGNGDGTLQTGNPISLSSSFTPLSVAAGDVNKDGNADLIMALGASSQGQPGAIAILLGNGKGTFQTPQVTPLPGPIILQAIGAAATAGLAVGDLNGDGIPDVVTAINGATSNQVAVLLGIGNGSFKPAVLSNTATSPPEILIGDIDGDGKPDLLLADCCGLSEASFLAGNGDGTFQAELQFSSGPNPAGLATADFNGDGHLDIAVAGSLQMPAMGTLAVLYDPFSEVGVPPLATVLSAANSTGGAIAPGSLATAYGSDLAKGTPGATSAPLPTSFGGTSVAIIDSAGTSWPAPLIYVSKGQVNFYVPSGVATGRTQINVTSGDGTQSFGSVQVVSVAPGIFTLNSANLAAAVGIFASSNGTQTPIQVYKVNSAGAVIANPINLGSASDQVYLELYGTGIQAAGTSNVEVTVGGTKVPVQYAGKSSFEGEDQVNILLPHSLAGAGNVTVQVTASGIAANPVQITIQ
jgi:uncharacterized protein (TIGR03437 family)